MYNLKEYIQNNSELLLKTLKELCLIPAPSQFEQKRAEYCKAWLEKSSLPLELEVAIKSVTALTEND